MKIGRSAVAPNVDRPESRPDRDESIELHRLRPSELNPFRVFSRDHWLSGQILAACIGVFPTLPTVRHTVDDFARMPAVGLACGEG